MSQPRRLLTINRAPFADPDRLRAHLDRVAAVAADADLVVLPETCLGQRPENAQWLDEAVGQLGEFAAKHGAYVVAGLDHQQPGGRFNSVYIFDRSGVPMGRYDKRYPYWPELDLDPPVQLGRDTLSVPTDFGRLGVATCFDVNFPAVWADLRRAGADLVVWPSAYAGGTILGAYATIHHYHVLSCTQPGDSRLYAPTGRPVPGLTYPALAATVFDVDVDTGYYHENFNLDRLERLLADHDDEVAVDRMRPEEWIVLTARSRDVSARAVAAQYGMEELRDYITRSELAIDQRRGQ